MRFFLYVTGTCILPKQDIQPQKNMAVVPRRVFRADVSGRTARLSDGLLLGILRQKAEDLHERERDIKAARGRIIDATGKILATNKSVCTISVIHSQIDEPEKVIAALQKELGLTEEEVRKRVEKVSSIERVKTNVDKETGDRIRAYGLCRNQGRRGLQAVLPFGYHGVHGARLYGCG